MSVIIVMGPPASGKSTFIKENFKNKEVIDLFDFQEHILPTYESIWQSYVDCAECLKEKIKEGKDVILEHTLLKRKRREWYISQIREVTDDDIIICCILPTINEYYQRCKKRNQPIIKSTAKSMLDELEIPTKDEGYKSVYIINAQKEKI